MKGNLQKQSPGKKKVLVIEDEPDLRQLTSWMLEAEGYQPLLAADGDEGLRIAREQDIALVLLDIRMQGRYGWSVLKEMKNTPQLRDIPVIIVTASADADYKSRAVQMGAADYLVKPINAELMKRCIDRVLGGGE
jgi:DNA-binding response OmpR family regulator